MLVLEDNIYGNFEVDGILEELVSSSPVQRLKGIHQGGAIFLVDSSQQHTRYEHSIGVLCLVRHFGGSVEEQIAALLHDVSHTAFSHVGDQVFNHPDEDYHEHIFADVIERSEIPMILAKYGYDQVLKHFDQYTLLERPLPELCADRIDYTLRDLYHAGLISLTEIQHFMLNLTVGSGCLTPADEASARWLSMQFKKLNEAYLKKPEYLYANQRMAELIKTALSKGLLEPADMQMDDEAVLAKLRSQGYSDELKAISKLDGFEQFEVKGAAERIKRRELHPAVSN
ncbi:HD domain-containing protein [Mucilaginibacter lacusdianchii]|uniref:HD domain-containing protein n=1 Tax=Mucilaginibacter lacusdianchii TaxID=2684211 RepID=UPI00131B73D4|nr:HD domain-containing protein [Mucilaginibacter sp. JXJ CY 39]